MREVTLIQDVFLSDLTEEDFYLDTRFKYVPSVTGRISKSGLEKLLNDDKVLGIAPNSLDSIN